MSEKRQTPSEDKGLIDRVSELEEIKQEQDLDYERLFRELQRPIRKVGASVPGAGDTVTVTSSTLVTVGDPVRVEVPDGSEVIITIQGRLSMTTTSSYVSTTYAIFRDGTQVTSDIERQYPASPNNQIGICRVLHDKLSAGVYTYELQAVVNTGTTAEYIGIQWLIELRPARTGVLNKD